MTAVYAISHIKPTMPYRIMHRRIVADMEPRQLLRSLMKRAGDTPSSLARTLNHEKATQPQIHKFANGDVREPRRAMLSPIADHYKVPVDAFYDAEIAERIAQELGLDRETDILNAPDLVKSKVYTVNESQPVLIDRGKSWPFRKVSYQRFMALPSAARLEIEDHLALLVAHSEARHGLDAQQTGGQAR